MSALKITRRTVLGALAAPAIVRAAEPVRLRCSLDTAPAHGRNVAIADYLGKLEDSAGGRIKTELFQSGALFADLDVGKALVQGQVEMAVPGTWTLTGLVPDADMFQLPALYGQPIEILHRVTDGPAGAALNKALRDKLRVVMLGPWLDLGYQNWYTTSKTIRTIDDLRGLKIRNSGGAGQAWRARFVGAIPITTPWPNVPLALSQGTFDGLVTSTESLVSAQLWDAGLRHSFEDHQFFAVYLPMVSEAFWRQLTPDLQGLMTSLWLENISAYRSSMADRQEAARETALAHGLTFTVPTAAATEATRTAMLAQQDQMARDIKVSPELVRMVSADAGVTG